MNNTEQHLTDCEPSNRRSVVSRPPVWRQRGFTLIELMAVVIMIGILVALAVPATRLALQGTRTSGASKEIQMIYQMARMRAIGRGSAVLVRFNPNAPDTGFSVREAIAGGSSGGGTCNLRPVSSCIADPTQWSDPTKYRVIRTFKPLKGGTPGYENMFVTFTEHAGSSNFSRSMADICFTPSGNTFIRTTPAGAFQLMTSIPELKIGEKNDANQIIGIQRSLFILPNGIARLAI